MIKLLSLVRLNTVNIAFTQFVGMCYVVIQCAYIFSEVVHTCQP